MKSLAWMILTLVGIKPQAAPRAGR